MIKKHKVRVYKIALIVSLVLVMASCATRVRLQAQRMPTLDTASIQSLAVMPFGVARNIEVYRSTAQHVTSVATDNIRATNQFRLVSPSEIERLRRANQSIEGYADALFTGQILRITSNDSEQERQRRNREGEMETFILHVREVELEFNYHLMRTRDGTLIGPVTRRGTDRSTSENRAELQSVDNMLRNIVNTQLRQLYRDVVPHTIPISRSLERERDRSLQDQMRAAEAQVRARNYRAALEEYLLIYRTSGSIAAAINASILYEALGETQTAANFMAQVHADTGNPRARDVLNRLNRELQQQAGVAGHAQTPIERLTIHTSEEIRRIIPANARVWIYNSAAGSMVDDIADNITADFIRRGIALVDRQNAALIDAERRFHLSGAVSDDDFLSVGNAAGASIIVTLGISGTGALRRLQVRILDIERGIPIMQSDTSEVWRL